MKIHYFKENLIDTFSIENQHFVGVTFDNCTIGSNDIDNLQKIKDVTFENCYFLFTDFRPCILENVRFKDTKFEDYGILWSPFFNQVTIEGKITSFRINSTGFISFKTPEFQAKLDAFRVDFYQKVKWALDISKAKLSSFDYEDIPARLFVRDPETQFVITKEKFHSLSQLDDSFKQNFSYVTMYLENFLESEATDKVLTVPMARPKKFRQPILEGLQELRRQGLAEKD